MTESKIVILPYDLNCPALNRCGGFLRTYGVEHGPDEIPTIKYFICSNRNSDKNSCPCNPMISKYGESKCGGCGETIQKVVSYNHYFIITILFDGKLNIPTINHREK